MWRHNSRHTKTIGRNIHSHNCNVCHLQSWHNFSNEHNKYEIWQLVSGITICYIWKVYCLKIFQNVTERLAHIIYGICTKIVHNLKGSLDNIKRNMQQAEHKRLEFHAAWDKCIFYRRISDKVEWFYSTQKYLFKSTIRSW